MSLIFLWSSLLSLVGIWALWVYGFRRLAIEEYRFHLLALKSQVTSLAGGEVTPDGFILSELHTLDGLSEIAPTVGLFHFVLTREHMRKHHPHELGESLAHRHAALDKLNCYARERMQEIDYRVSVFTLRFLLVRAPISTVLGYTWYFVHYLSGHRRSATPPVEKLRVHAKHQIECVEQTRRDTVLA
jgi:hypothetical protein